MRTLWRKKVCYMNWLKLKDRETPALSICALNAMIRATLKRKPDLIYYVPIPDEGAPVLKDLEKALAWAADCMKDKDGANDTMAV